MKTKRIRSFITAAILTGLLSGCAANTSTGANASAVQSGDSSSASVKTVNVALEAASRPLSFENEKGEKVGYEVEVLKAVDDLIPDYQFNVELVESDATQIGLETGKYALIGGGLYKTAEREKKYLLPNAITGVSLINIYVSEDNNSIQKLDDLVGKKLVPSTPNGGIFNLLTAYNKEHPDKQITIATGDGISVADRFKSVSDKQYDALVLPNNLGFSEIKEQLGIKVKAVTPPVKINGTYFALAKDQADLSAKVEQALKTLRENGTLSKLSETWYGEDTIKYAANS